MKNWETFFFSFFTGTDWKAEFQTLRIGRRYKRFMKSWMTLCGERYQLREMEEEEYIEMVR